HGTRTDAFTPKEALIRDTFDRFLDGLETCAAHVESGLVSSRDFAPYLDYWAYHIQHARAEDPRTGRLTQLRAFAEAYGYKGALTLIRQLATHYHPPPPSRSGGS